MFAENKRPLLMVLRAVDPGGKDGSTRHVMTGLNPAGVQVTSFKVPTELERNHDFLWRIHQAVPRRGDFGIFNRSHYEDGTLKDRSEEHTSELQSLRHLVCRLLLENKKRH